MVVLVAEAVTAVGALDPVELGRLAQFQGEADLDRDGAAPPPDVTEIHPVGEHAGQERVLGDLLGDPRGDGADPGDLAQLALPDVFPTTLRDLVLTSTTSSGRWARPSTDEPESIFPNASAR